MIFLLGMFWDAARPGRCRCAIGSAVLSFVLKMLWPALPPRDRVGLVFRLPGRRRGDLAPAVAPDGRAQVDLKNIDYSTSTGFNVGLRRDVILLPCTVWW